MQQPPPPQMGMFSPVMDNTPPLKTMTMPPVGLQSSDMSFGSVDGGAFYSDSRGAPAMTIPPAMISGGIPLPPRMSPPGSVGHDMSGPSGLSGSKSVLNNMYNLMIQVTRPEKHVQIAGADPTIPPNRTLYVNNLNDKISTKVLTENLNALFSPFGEIIQIVAMNSFWRRGQAFIAFKSLESATTALEKLQGFIYEGKPMRVNYARSKSDVFAKEDGTYEPREKGPKKPKAVLERERLIKTQFAQLQHQLLSMQNPTINAPGMDLNSSEFNLMQMNILGGVSSIPPFVPPPSVQVKTEPNYDEEEEGRKRKAFSLSLKQSSDANLPRGPLEKRDEQIRPPAPIPTLAPVMSAGQSLPSASLSLPLGVPKAPGSSSIPPAVSHQVPSGFPSRSLFLDGLPADCTTEELESIYSKMGGFDKVRHVASRKLAFVDFKSEMFSAAALSSTYNTDIREGVKLRVSFAKK